VSKRDKIINLSKNQNDIDLSIEILEFLRENHQNWKEVKNFKNLEIIIQDRKDYLEEIEEDIKAKKTLDRYYNGQLQTKEKQLGLPNKY
jgi:hypothetical protein